MSALSVPHWAVVVLIALTDIGLAQQPAATKPEVISITGIGVVLPRQAGTKDAPGVSLTQPGVFELQSASSAPWISESGARPATSTASASRKKAARRR